MEFKIEKKQREKSVNYPNDEIDTARKFAEKIYKEFGDFIKAVVLFGSVVKKDGSKHDIDVLIILDDVKVKFSRDLVQAYRIIVEKVIADVDPKRLHIQSMKFTSFWEYARAGDPVAMNILRNGLALIDTGFFDPLQQLLDEGRIRPSDEAVYTYFTMAPASLHRSSQHLLTATVDLYWAAIDSAHAALMNLGEIPPSPDHVAEMLEKRLVKKGHVNKKYAAIMKKLYAVFKKIVYREITEIDGKTYDSYRGMAEEFVDGMKGYIEKKK
ncbi:nucleotidyltransferase domain-containing protein [Candidatus Woesearchaeota archaeon]|nr:nucleotidyltransferase domain-containing protein [Candidatus Woesearchaeota archaeon]